MLTQGHYINSADLEENASIHGQLTMGIVTNQDPQTWKEMNPNGVQVGSRRGIFLGESGDLKGIQAEPNQLSDKLMERKEQQMINLGARIVENRGAPETATGRRIDAAGENSVLSDLVENVELAYREAIEACMMFVTATPQEFTLDLNRDFFPDDVDPQLLMASIQLRDRGVIGIDDLQDLSRKAGVTTRSNEEINESVELEGPYC